MTFGAKDLKLTELAISREEHSQVQMTVNEKMLSGEYPGVCMGSEESRVVGME